MRRNSSNFDNLPALVTDFDQLLEQSFPALNRLNSLFSTFFDEGDVPSRDALALDVRENEDAYRVSFELPGVKKDAIDLDIEGNVLSVKATRAWKEGEKEQSATYSRSVQLPDGIDTAKASARYEDGVLEIELPKEEVRKPRRIEVA